MSTKKEEKRLIELCAEAVHKSYCKCYKKREGKEYWTKGDYNKLNEETKEIDRETVKAVLKILKKEELGRL